MKTIRSVILCAVIAILASCVSTGTKFDVAKTNEIKPRVTTVAELTRWFGKPWSKRPQKDGTIQYVWQYTKAAAMVGVTEQQVLTVFAPADEKVKDFSLKQK